MNAAQIHLALNHAPLFLSAIGGGILLLGMYKRNESIKNLSLFILVAAAVFTAPVFLTGEGTEELVEHAAGVSESSIGRHEEMAKISLIVIVITGVFALTGIILKKKAAVTKFILAAALLLSLASFGTMAWTAHLGGLIRHTEIQAGAATGNNETDGEKEDEEDQKNRVTPPEGNVTKDSLVPAEKGVNKKDDDD